MSTKIREIQQRLTDVGYNPGIVDGLRGRNTINAIKKFQIDKGLKVDGLVGPQTYAILFSILVHAAPSIDGTPWIDEALRVMGLHEIHNHKTLSAWLRSDGKTVGDPAKIPWCGDFVQTAIALSMPEESLPENPYLAANWAKFGKAVTPQYGAVMSFWRGSPTDWRGHVAFYLGEDSKNYYVLGGNQSNKVSKTFIAKNRLRKNGSRWPLSAITPSNKKTIVSSSGKIISTNEE